LIFLLAGAFLLGSEARGRSGVKITALPPPPSGTRRPVNQEIILEDISRRPLSWPAVREAALYHLQIASDQRFRRLVISVFLNPSRFIIKALPRGTFYWRVSSVNEDGMEGKFSSIYYFVYPLPTSPGALSAWR
jgi:hypothetical protein